MSAVAPVRGLHDLTQDELTLLRKLDETTPPVYRRQQRDHRPFEDVAQDAGLWRVGEPTGRAPMLFARLAEAGYVERVKDPSGPVRYRVSQLGERELLTAAATHWKMQHDDVLEKWNADSRRLSGELSQARGQRERALARIAELERPFWRKILNRPPKEDDS